MSISLPPVTKPTSNLRERRPSFFETLNPDPHVKKNITVLTSIPPSSKHAHLNKVLETRAAYFQRLGHHSESYLSYITTAPNSEETSRSSSAGAEKLLDNPLSQSVSSTITVGDRNKERNIVVLEPLKQAQQSKEHKVIL